MLQFSICGAIIQISEEPAPRFEHSRYWLLAPTLVKKETIFIMTNQQPNQQQYWQIQLPLAKFPKSKFQFGDRVAQHWEDDQGDHYCDIGEIIGMEYVAECDCPAQWYYRLRFVRYDYQPSLVGTYDQYYEPESCLVADQEAMED